MGAPLGNDNATKSGLHSRHSLILGDMPPQFKLVERHTNAMRREVEAAVLAARGHLSLMDDATIQTACRWERVSQMAHRWIEEGVGEMTQSERLHFANTIARASAERDKCLRSLGLDASGSTTLEALYDMPMRPSDEDDATGDDQGDEPPATDAAAAPDPLEDLPVLATPAESE